MEPTGIFQKLKDAGVEGVLEFATFGEDEAPPAGDLAIMVEPDKLPGILTALKEDGDLLFDQLSLISGVDCEDRFECVYHLISTVLKHAVVLKLVLDRDEPAVPTASTVYPTAEWHERETYDLVGIRFEGHPDLRRIYLPEEWEGHPLRRDYQYPREFQGIPLYDAKREEWDKESMPKCMAEIQEAERREAEDKAAEEAEKADE
jgi:NADH-quinone oxidoreductase subunit C